MRKVSNVFVEERYTSICRTPQSLLKLNARPVPVVMLPSFGAQVRQQTQAQFDRLFLQSNPASNNALQEGMDTATQAATFERLFRSIYHVGSVCSSAPAASEPPKVGTSQGSPSTGAINSVLPPPPTSSSILAAVAHKMQHSGNSIGGQYGKREPGVKDDLCPFCVPGSGNLRGHRGKHRLVERKTYEQGGECSLCVPGSGKLSGHLGRHLKIDVTESDHPAGPCPLCVKESGRLVGHRGRHTTGNASHRRRKGDLLNLLEPCPRCPPGLGLPRGHNGPCQFASSVLRVNLGSPDRDVPVKDNSDSPISSPEPKMSEYELRRLARIRENEEHMRQLGLVSLKEGAKQEGESGNPVVRKKRGRPRKEEQREQASIVGRREPSKRQREPTHFFAEEQVEEWRQDGRKKLGTEVKRRGRPPKSITAGPKIAHAVQKEVRALDTAYKEDKDCGGRGYFSQHESSLQFLRRSRLVARAGEVLSPGCRIVHGNGLNGTKLFHPLVVTIGRKKKNVYRCLRPPRDERTGQVAKEDQNSFFLVSKHINRRNKKAWFRECSLQQVAEELEREPLKDALQPFEFIMKNICQVCLTQCSTSRALLSHKRACARRNGIWGDEAHMGTQVSLDAVREVENSVYDNPRRVRRLQKEKMRRLRPAEKSEKENKADRLVSNLQQAPASTTEEALTKGSKKQKKSHGTFFNSLFSGDTPPAFGNSHVMPIANRADRVSNKMQKRDPSRGVKRGMGLSIVAMSASSDSDWDPVEENIDGDSDSSSGSDSLIKAPPIESNFLGTLF